MSRKSKHSQERKIEAVKKYQSGISSANRLSEEYGAGKTTIRRWITNYESMGAEGLADKVSNAAHSIEVKRVAVAEYLSGRYSLQDIQKKYKIRSDCQLRAWIKWYNSHGEFKQPNSGGEIYMTQSRQTTQEERIEIVSHCISNNKDYGKTIERYRVSYNQVYGWVRKYENEGVTGLIDGRGKRKDKSSMSEVEKLRAQLKLKEAENMRLQMENELLKKLEALERGEDD